MASGVSCISAHINLKLYNLAKGVDLIALVNIEHFEFPKFRNISCASTRLNFERIPAVLMCHLFMPVLIAVVFKVYI